MSWKKDSKYDPSLEVLTPEGVKFVLSPAGLPVRALAYAIDKVIQWLILLLISIGSYAVQFRFGIWLLLILNFLVDWFYHIIFELAFRGQSPGKRLTGIRVIRSDGAPVDASSSFLRNLLRFADTFFFFFPIALISITVSRGFKRIGDWAGGTIVVYTQRSIGIPRNIKELLNKHPPVILTNPLSYDEKQTILNFARRYPLFGESRADEIAGIYVPYLKNNADSSQTNAKYLLGIARNLMGEPKETLFLKEALFPKETS